MVLIPPTLSAKGGFQASLQNRGHCASDGTPSYRDGIAKPDCDNTVAAPREIQTIFGNHLSWSAAAP